MQTQYVNIIIEGLSFTNTKSIALALSEYPRLVGKMGYQRYTAVISSKWGNFKDFPWGKNLISFDPIDEDQAMKNYGVWMRLIELQRHYNWIIDCFHLSSQQYQIQNNNNKCDFLWLENRLLNLGFHLVHLVQNDTVLESIITSRDDVNINHRLDQVIRERDLLRRLVSNSVLPTLNLDISEMDVGDTIDNITDWYEEVSGYTQPEHQPLEKIFLPSC